MITGLLLFLAELLLWGGFTRGVWLLLGAASAPMRIGGTVLSLILLLFFWGLFVSPKGPKRLRLLPRLVWIALLSMSSAAALLARGDLLLGGLLIAILPVLIFGQRKMEKGR